MTELDINTDPNRPAAAALRLLLPTAELASVNSMVQVGNNAAGFAGQRNSADNYNLDNNSYNGTWNNFYQSMQNVEEIRRQQRCNPLYRGIALVLKAYAVGNMVDQFAIFPTQRPGRVIFLVRIGL